MFRLFLPTIIRELLSSTKVTCALLIYGGDGVVAACLFMYPMFLGMSCRSSSCLSVVPSVLSGMSLATA